MHVKQRYHPFPEVSNYFVPTVFNFGAALKQRKISTFSEQREIIGRQLLL